MATATKRKPAKKKAATKKKVTLSLPKKSGTKKKATPKKTAKKTTARKPVKRKGTNQLSFALPKKLTADLKKKGVTQKMLNEIDKTGKAQVVKAAKKQSGTSNAAADRRKRALPPGKRVSKTGNVYFETRKNRSDRKGSRI